MRTIIKTMVLTGWVAWSGVVIVGCDQPTRVSAPPTSERTVGEELDDKALTANVKGALRADPMRFQDVQITAYRGVVQLSGFADTGDQKNRANEIAQAIPGVKKVQNNISVKEAKAP